MHIPPDPFFRTPTAPGPEPKPEPEPEPEQARPKDLDKVLGAVPAPAEEEGNTGSAERDFFERTRLTSDHVGLTGLEAYQMQSGEKVDASPEDEAILEALIIDGFYKEDYTLGRVGGFTLRTIGPLGMNNSVAAISEVVGETKVTNAAMSALSAARMLAVYNGKNTCEFVDSRTFESKEALVARLKLCMTLPTPIIDVINDRAMAFVNRVTLSTSRNTQAFSASPTSGLA